MPPQNLSIGDVLAATGGQLLGQARPELVLTGVGHDSRAIRPGMLFVALRGPQHDGHDFVAEAFARGAAAALVERIPADVFAVEGAGPPNVLVPDASAALQALAAYWRERQPAEVIVVAGSVGKTTTAELIAAVLGQRRRVGRASATRRADVTLPQALLELRAEVTRLVLEVDLSDDRDVARLTELARPRTVVVTSIEPLHGEPTARLEQRARPIRQLIASLGGGAVILNGDDELVAGISPPEGVRAVRFGIGQGADVRAENLSGHGLHGMVFDLVADRQRVHVRLPAFGLHSVHGALAAAAAGIAEGLDLREVGAGLQGAWGQSRIIAAIGLNGSRIIDDSYNASPESTLEALNLLAGLDGRKIAVLGDMLGLEPYETAGHRKVGNRAAGVVDELVVLGERAALIADEARRMGLPAGSVVETRTTDEAIEQLRRRLRPGDNVLIKGSRELRMDRIVRAIRLEG